MKSMGPSEVRQAEDLSALETVLVVSGVNKTLNDNFFFFNSTLQKKK